MTWHVRIASLHHSESLSFDRLELDFSLGCDADAPLDVFCPQWDHVITMQVCALDGADGATCDATNDGVELGRWVTTFSRTGGRWLTDVSALAPLLGAGGGRANVTIMTVPWAGNQGAIAWSVRLAFRFVSAATDEGDAIAAGGADAAVRGGCLGGSLVRVWADVGEAIWDRDGNGVYSYFEWISFNQVTTKISPFTSWGDSWTRVSPRDGQRDPATMDPDHPRDDGDVQHRYPNHNPENWKWNRWGWDDSSTADLFEMKRAIRRRKKGAM